jgi:hypothetical protein
MDFTKEATEKYQCPGCTNGSDTQCGSYVASFRHEACVKHRPDTWVTNVGSIFLGLPNGFNRTGQYPDMQIEIHRSLDFDTETVFDRFNIPVWKTKYQGDTLVRGLRPRLNEPFLVIIQGESHFDTINCMEISAEDIAKMD